MIPATPRYLAGSCTDQGSARDNNEDRVHYDDVRGIFLVIDGMGGHAAGEQAAEIAVELIRTRLERQTDAVDQRVREAITLANNAIFDAAQANEEWRGMACVLTVAVIESGSVTIGHVGDSRLYKIRPGKIDKITRDHSPVGEREDAREFTEEEAMRHPRRNEVYRDVGSVMHTPHDEDFIDIVSTTFEPDSAMLLCSDGLSDVLTSREILRIVEENAGDPRLASRRLVETADENPKDNISVVLVEGEGFASALGRPAVYLPDKSTPAGLSGENTALGRARLVSSSPSTPATPVGSAPRVPLWRTPWVIALGGVVAGLFAGLAIPFVWNKPAAVLLHRELRVAPRDAPYATLFAAVDAARSGDTVLVGGGVYREFVRLKDGVDVVAETAHAAVIEGSVVAEDIRSARFEGFEVKGADGIQILSSDIRIARCEISRSRAAGIVFRGKSRGALVACSIHDNAGPGIAVEDSAAPDIENNVVVGNGTGPRALAPGMLLKSSGHPRVTGNLFLSNGADAIRSITPIPDLDLNERNYFSVGDKPVRPPTPRPHRLRGPSQ